MRRLFYTDHCPIPLPPGHRFPIEKYGLLRTSLRDERFRFDPAPFANPTSIKLAHNPEYVDDFLNGSLRPAVMRRIGFPWSKELVRRTLASAGGTISAAEEALDQGWGGTLAGGTHHALRGEGAGYCVFNDLAIVILKLRQEGRIRTAAVLDVDVHQGDGTAQIFEHDPAVLTASLHSRANFPFRKQRSSLDVELEQGTTDIEYLRALDQALPRVFSFEPDILLYQSGVDGLAADRLGKLSLTHEGLRERDRRVFEAAKANAVPLVITLGGGYSVPIHLSVEAHANTFRTALAVFG